jgi:serine/threonine-protein kinase
MVERIKYYRVKRKIGSGGMAAVYEALDTRNQGRVALKVLHPHLADQPTYIARFQREAQLAMSLRSPHIVQVLEYGAEKGLYYLAMEYVAGVTLQQFVQQRGALAVAQVLDIAYQAAQALEEAGRHGIVHRDIKPQNIMITPAGMVKVMDFGIARAMTLDSVTMTGMFVGTPHYSSPEQAVGDPVDIRSDIYSLGVVLYQLLTGTVPFQADTPQALLLRVMQGNPVPVQHIRVDLPKTVSELVDRMLQRDPARRFANPAELCAAIQALLGPRPLDTRAEMATMIAPLLPATPPPAVRASAKIPPVVWGAGGALAVTALAVTLLLWPKPSANGVTPTPMVTPAAVAGVTVTMVPTAPPASAVPSATSTPTPAPTSTSRPTATASATPSESTVTPTVRSSATLTSTPTATPVTPTRAATPTATPAPLLLAAPAASEPADGASLTGSVLLRWQVVPGAASYRVELRSDRPDQTNWRPWSASAAELRLVFDEDPGYFKDPGTVYYWRVAAVDASGRPGSASAPRNFVFQRQQEKPDPPTPDKPKPPTP